MPQLDELVAQFYDDPSRLGVFESVTREQLPVDFERLLAHSNHMTVTVEAFHGCPVDVQVLSSNWLSPIYRRKILLRRSKDQAVVQFGLVVLDTTFLNPKVTQEILAGKTPLGRVLIENNVMRQVHLAELWRIQCGPDLATAFHMHHGDVVYGRTARIDFDGHAALQLLEIVSC